MDTAQIQNIISRQFADPQSVLDLQKLLKVVADRQGAQPNAMDLAHGSSFVYNYMEQVPYLLTVAWTSARNVGLETEVTSILKMVESYWIEDDDVIPDSLGIFGLLDDAYCSLLSLQTLSDLYRMQSGKHLFPDDLTAANKIMRKIIGEPYTSELDELVGKAIAEARVEEAVKWLASPEKQQLLDSQATIWNHGPVSQLPVSQLKGLGLTPDP
ncbi:MAG: hypothetical protein WBN06_08075 [Lysobacterales bacterium]|jgi:uncharacterized membrane protein YkvA (DUF1232 family)